MRRCDRRGSAPPTTAAAALWMAEKDDRGDVAQQASRADPGRRATVVVEPPTARSP